MQGLISVKPKEYLNSLKYSFFKLSENDDNIDNTDLTKALAYLNLLASSIEKDICERAIEKLSSNMLKKLPLQPVATNEGACRIKVKHPQKTLFWIADSTALFKDRLPSKSLPKLITTKANKILQNSPNRVLWLSDLDEEIENDATGATDIVLGLALYKKFTDELWCFTVKTTEVYKPTYIDAGFTFYWYAAPKSTDYGWTRDLRNGLPKFKEWVTRNANADIIGWKAYPCPLNDQLVSSVDELPSTYVANCHQEILDYCNANPEYSKS